MTAPRAVPLSDGRVQLQRAADVVADRIRELIVSGELADGERLPRLDLLLDEFGISGPSMREALRMLESEGLITVQRGSIANNQERTRLYRIVELIGRWSMLDVFVAAFTVALVQLQPLTSVAPGAGVLFFAAVVVLTMLAAEAFDPRLIWDATDPPLPHHG